MSEEAKGAATSTQDNAQNQTADGQAEQNQENTGGKAKEGATDTLSIAYNHEQFQLTREEAVRLAQLGKRFEGKEALLQSAEAEFKRSGEASVEEFVRKRNEARDKQQVDALVADKGLSEEDARELLRLRQLEQQVNENQKLETERSKTTEELRALKERYPEVDLNSLPKEVAAYAVQHKVPILVAYENTVLLEKYRKELESAKQSQENNQASAGSVHSSFPANGTDSFDDLWAKGARR